MAQYFNGRFLVQPQASVFVDDSRLANLNPTAANTLAIVGPASAGAPKVPVLITDPNQARRVVRSGDLLDAILLAFDPSAQTGGASRIYAVRVNPAVQGKAKIFDSATPAKASATFTIAGTPASGNTIKVTLNGNDLTYTLQAGDTTVNTTAASLAAAINTLGGTGVVITPTAVAAFSDPILGVTATVATAVVTLTVRYPGADGNAITLATAVTGGGVTVTGTPATFSSGTGNTLCTMTSDDYGLYVNQMYYKTEAASVKGSKITFGLTTSGNIVGGTLARDNVYRDLLAIQYTGASAAATLTVNDTTLTTSCTTAVADNLNIAFSTFTTIQQVVDYINATGKYTVTLSAASSADLASAGQFDPKSAQDIKSSSQTLTANVQALIDVINANENIFSSAVRQTNPVSNTIPVTSNLFFTGGSDGTSTSTDWTNALAALQGVDVQIVVPVSDDAVVHAATKSHCEYMSTTGRMPRVAIVGGALNEYSGSLPTKTITDRVAAFNSPRVALVSPGIKFVNVLGQIVTKSAAFTAAMIGGMLASVSAGTPLTHKYLSNLQGLETVYTPADLDTLLLGGVLPIQYLTNKGYRVVQSKTTWTGAPNYAKNELSTVMAIDAVSRRVQDTLDDQLVGQKVDPTTLAQAVSITETVLKGSQTDGLIVGDSKSPAFKNITASTDGGDTIRVQWQMSPAIPANYILASVSAVPYSGSVTSVS